MAHKAGFVNIVGNPNVGKSTLMNLLVGERISIATFKAQTTRHRIMGILNTEDMQICFSDTPGVVSNQQELTAKVEAWHAVLPKAEIIPISALCKFNIDTVLNRIKELLPDSPPYFGKDQWTDKPARFFVTEIIREKILLYYDKEIPYSVEVVVEQFKEEAKSIHINVVIYVERDSQKGIIIGHRGVALKKVSTEARKSLEKFFGKSIYLETFVKVDKDWRSSERALKSFGYNLD